MKRKIICTVTNDLNYDQRMIRICSSLVKAGEEVWLIGREKTNSKILKEQSFHQKRLPCFFQKGKGFYLEYNLRLFFFLLFHGWDIVCSIDLDTILPGYMVSSLKGKTCVYDAHEYYTESPEIVGRPGIKKIWEWVARITIPKLKYCYTVCESLAEIFEKKYGIAFQVIRNVPFASEEIANPTKEPIILYQGALNEGRGLEQSIRVMQSIEDAKLWLVGEGDLSEELRELTTSLNLGHKVKFLGYQRPEDLKKITLQATFGLNLLENKGLNYYYSLANKAFDYIQLGLPSISMNFPEYQKINEQHSVFLLIDDLQPSTVVKAFHSLLKNKKLYANLRENCLNAREVFTWEKEEEKLIAFYSSI
ncbi:MAG: glycosyltransferase family 4 protein [Bacteroidetes bacterium]|nr:glycosyltransferase family 4 protein [Bacteroidota bacterium]